MNLFFWFLLLPALGYACLFVAAARYWTRWKPKDAVVVENPNISIAVVAAFRNEAARLPAFLEWWKNLNTKGYAVQFILADDHSSDGSGGLIRDFQQVHPDMPLKLMSLEEGMRGKKAALSVAISSSNAELCLLTDADCYGSVDWLQCMAASMLGEGRKMVCGPVCLEQGRSFLRRFQSLEHAGLVAFGAVSMRLGRPTMCNGASLMFYRHVWEELGGYEAHRHLPGGDDELFMRAVHRAYPGAVGFCKHPGALVHTAAAPNLKSFMMQRLRWASKGSMQGGAVRLFRSVLVLWYAVLLLSLPMLFRCNALLTSAVLGAWSLKLASEWFYFRSIASLFRIRVHFAELVSFQGFQTIYPLLIALARLLRIRFSWKDRAY